MKVGIIGVGRIGGNLAAQWARRGHDVLISFKRNRDELAAMADAIGARWGSVGDAVEHGDSIVVSVPWPTLDAVDPTTQRASREENNRADGSRGSDQLGHPFSPPPVTAKKISSSEPPWESRVRSSSSVPAAASRPL